MARRPNRGGNPSSDNPNNGAANQPPPFNTRRGRGEGKPSLRQYSELFVAFAEYDVVRTDKGTGRRGFTLAYRPMVDGKVSETLVPLSSTDENGNPVFCEYTPAHRQRALEEYYYEQSKEAEKTNPDGSVWRRIETPDRWLMPDSAGYIGGWVKKGKGSEWVPAMNPDTGRQYGVIDEAYVGRLARSIVWEEVLQFTPAQVDLFADRETYHTKVAALKRILKPLIDAGRIVMTENEERAAGSRERTKRRMAADGSFGWRPDGNGNAAPNSSSSSTSNVSAVVVEKVVEKPVNVFKTDAFELALHRKGRTSAEARKDVEAAFKHLDELMTLLNKLGIEIPE